MKAKEYYEKVEQQTYNKSAQSNACFRLGEMYYQGQGLINEKLAKTYLQRALNSSFSEQAKLYLSKIDAQEK